MTLPKTKVIKNSTRKYTNEYTTKAKSLSEKHQKDKLREIYGGLCCICGKWPMCNVLYDVDGAKRIERYCQNDFDVYKERIK